VDRSEHAALKHITLVQIPMGAPLGRRILATGIDGIARVRCDRPSNNGEDG
jgi:hypothetical protein